MWVLSCTVSRPRPCWPSPIMFPAISFYERITGAVSEFLSGTNHVKMALRCHSFGDLGRTQYSLTKVRGRAHWPSYYSILVLWLLGGKTRVHFLHYGQSWKQQNSSCPIWSKENKSYSIACQM
jgi:hypothetical protein